MHICLEDFLFSQISDQIRGNEKSDKAHATSMEYSLLMTTFISILGGFCFVMCAFYIVKDREKAEAHTRTREDESSLLGSVASERYPPSNGEYQAVENEDEDDDKLVDVDPVTPTPSERETLVVPVDVHSAPPVQEANNHAI